MVNDVEGMDSHTLDLSSAAMLRALRALDSLVLQVCSTVQHMRQCPKYIVNVVGIPEFSNKTRFPIRDSSQSIDKSNV